MSPEEKHSLPGGLVLNNSLLKAEQRITENSDGCNLRSEINNFSDGLSIQNLSEKISVKRLDAANYSKIGVMNFERKKHVFNVEGS